MNVDVKKVQSLQYPIVTRSSAVGVSQRDRATLRVTEYLAKSLKVIRNDTVA